MATFEILPDIILRSPLLSYEDYDPANLQHVVQTPYFLFAIFLASPDLFKRFEAKKFDFFQLNEKERATFLKYYNRMSFRCTPFGAFSSFSTATWDIFPSFIKLTDPDKARLSMLIDQAMVDKFLAAHRSDNILLYACNPTLYNAGKMYRYIKIHWDDKNGKVNYEMEELEITIFLRQIVQLLKNQPCSFEFILKFTVDNNICTEEQAREYIYFLINEQIIKSSLSPNVLGQDQLSGFNFSMGPYADPILKSLMEEIRFVNPFHLHELRSVSEKIRTALSGKINERENFFYSCLEQSTSGCLNIGLQQQIMEAVDCLGLLVPQGISPALGSFIENFKERYGAQKISLLQALDPEIGLGFGTANQYFEGDNLLNDVSMDTQESKSGDSFHWTAVHRLLMSKWQNEEALDPGIKLLASDVKALKYESGLNLPPSIPVVFSFAGEQLLIEAIGGCTALALIGRFTLVSPKIKEIADKIADHEQRQNDQLIFAEINHLTDKHVDNINRRLPVYNYEIPLFSSFSNDKHIIELDDLYLSISNGELVMEAKSLNKRVIPRFTSAYNYHLDKLDLFRFLCSIQHINLKSNFALDLEALFPGLNYYPRVSYNNTILAVAKWLLTEAEKDELFGSDNTNALVRLNRLIEVRHLPRFAALVSGDQQLVFDLQKEQDKLFFLQCVKSCKGKSILTEYLKNRKPPLYNHLGKAMSGQFISFLLSQKTSYSRLPVVSVYGAKIGEDSNFLLGSEWTYLKIYCAPHRTNELLTENIFSILNSKLKKDILSWFFIRYNDKGHHLRLRLNIKTASLNLVLRRFNEGLQEDVKCGIIQDYQAHVYRPETDRYGNDIILIIERVFCVSSELVLMFLRKRQKQSIESPDYTLAFLTVRKILKLFFSDLSTLIEFTQCMADLFLAENSNPKPIKVAMDQKYRSLKAEINDLFENESEFYRSLKLIGREKRFMRGMMMLVKVSADFDCERRERLISDVIHMHLNRIFIQGQRSQEMVIYYCLNKHFQFLKATKEDC